ncbi:MAG: hypothetical protein JRJ45_00145 [Deltaproteobacteria bacterium]|nr:hypothetical protein [Deltaproteobacteria bacterium]
MKLTIEFPVHKDEVKDINFDVCKAIDDIRHKRTRNTKDKNLRIIAITIEQK